MPDNAPCYECPYRKLYCHDRCEEYLAVKAERDAAKKELRKSREALDYLIREFHKRERKVGKHK